MKGEATLRSAHTSQGDKDALANRTRDLNSGRLGTWADAQTMLLPSSVQLIEAHSGFDDMGTSQFESELAERNPARSGPLRANEHRRASPALPIGSLALPDGWCEGAGWAGLLPVAAGGFGNRDGGE